MITSAQKQPHLAVTRSTGSPYAQPRVDSKNNPLGASAQQSAHVLARGELDINASSLHLNSEGGFQLLAYVIQYLLSRSGLIPGTMLASGRDAGHCPRALLRLSEQNGHTTCTSLQESIKSRSAINTVHTLLLHHCLAQLSTPW